MKRYMQKALLCALFLGAQGCAVVEIEGEASTSTVKLGVLRIEPAQDARSVVYRSRGIGVVPGHQGATIGLLDEQAAIVFAPEDCRIILFQPTRKDVDALVEALAVAAKPQEICTVGAQ